MPSSVMASGRKMQQQILMYHAITTVYTMQPKLVQSISLAIKKIILMTRGIWRIQL